MGGDYADQPPSNRTSASPRIQLYENSTPRVMNSLALSQLALVYRVCCLVLTTL